MSEADETNDPIQPPAKLSVCLVQAYRAVSYVRGATLKAGLASARSISLSLAMNRSAGFRRYCEAIRGLLAAKREVDPDIYILAFRGHEIAWLARRLTRDRIFVFDAMMSPYGALAEEGKHGILGRMAAALWKPFERGALMRSDAILTDTESHSEYFQSEFGVPRHKIIVVPVGAVEPPISSAPTEKRDDGAFRILFYGSFLPLHGIEVILDAAAILHDLPIRFDFIGGDGEDALNLAKRMRECGRVRFTHRAWVPFDDILGREIPSADLCLGGPFGDTPQSRRVITGKTHQSLASGKATIVGSIADECGFADKVNCLLVRQGDPRALADAIRWANENRDLLPDIGAAGRKLHEQRYASDVIGARLSDALSRLRAASHPRIRA